MSNGELDPEIAEALLDPETVEAIRLYDQDQVPLLPASNEGLEAEFFGKAYQYSRNWLLERGGSAPGAFPCVFVLSRAIQQDIERLGATIIPYLVSCSDADVAGKVLIANDDLSIMAEAPNTNCATPAAIAHMLNALGLADVAHAVFRPSRSEMIICRDGVLGPNSCVRIELGSVQQFSLLDLERTLWGFHRKFTQTPSGYLLCWRGSPTERVTIEQLERQISGLLAFYLGSIVGLDYVQMEHFTSHGRLDVKVAGQAMVPGIGPCALELKVLRSRQASNNAKKWTSVSVLKMVQHANEGVEQAVEYRKDIDGKVAYLCCFDARLEDADQPTVLKYAEENDVILRRYFLYDSPKSHRAAVAAAKKKSILLSGEVN